jgi:cytochrome c biogenesis factor
MEAAGDKQMIPEIGHFALILALAVALVQSIIPLIGAARGNASWMAMAAPSSVCSFCASPRRLAVCSIPSP